MGNWQKCLKKKGFFNFLFAGKFWIMKRAGVKSSFFCNKFITNAKPHLNNVFITNFFNKGYKILK